MRERLRAARTPPAEEKPMTTREPRAAPHRHRHRYGLVPVWRGDGSEVESWWWCTDHPVGEWVKIEDDPDAAEAIPKVEAAPPPAEAVEALRADIDRLTRYLVGAQASTMLWRPIAPSSPTGPTALDVVRLRHAIADEAWISRTTRAMRCPATWLRRISSSRASRSSPRSSHDR